MATSAALQAHYDEISCQMQVLPLAAAPKGFAQLDVSSLADGAASAAKIASLISKAAAELQQCQICGCACSSSQLGFLVSTQLDFISRSVRAAAAQFSCEVCRAVSNPTLLLQLSMPVPQSEDFAWADQLKELFLHFAAVNSAPAHITANPDSLALWVQELACRTHSLCVVANSLKGWKLVGPDGHVVQPGAAGVAVQLLQQLLSSSTAAAAPGKADARSGAASAAVAVGKLAKKRKQEQHAGVEQVRLSKPRPLGGSRPTSSMKEAREKQADGVAAVADADKQHATTLRAKTPNKQQAAKTPQQVVSAPEQKQQQAASTSKTPQHQLKTPKQQIGTPMLAHKQQQPGSSAVKEKKKAGMYPAVAAAEPTLSSKKRQLLTIAAAGHAPDRHQFVPFKSPQVTKSKKPAKSGKRKLSDPSQLA